MFTQIGHIVRKWDPNFKAMHPSLCQPKFASRSLQTSQHTHTHTHKVHLCKSHSSLQLNHSFQPFTNTFQTPFSCPKPPDTQQPDKWGTIWKLEEHEERWYATPTTGPVSDRGHMPGEPRLPVTLVWLNAQGVISTDTNQYRCQASIYLVAILSLGET